VRIGEREGNLYHVCGLDPFNKSHSCYKI
jgi:hypothetical protein